MKNRYFRLTLLLLVSLLLGACGGNGSVASGASQQARIATVNVSGDWVGNVSLNGQTEFLVLSLQQSDDNAIQARLYSRAGGQDYRLQGRISQRSVVLSGDAGDSAGEIAHFSLQADPSASYLNGQVQQSSQHEVSFERL